MKSLSCYAGYTYPGSFYCKNFVDIFGGKKAIKLLCHFAEKLYVHLVVEEAVYLENAAVFDLSVTNDTALKKLHVNHPLKRMETETHLPCYPFAYSVYLIETFLTISNNK